uniref:U-myrmeciitoxin(01)-Mg5a n=1 Tax=Myrmecia gulosa TaxID=36170 RepID=TX15A_MYRGU|nr:RecName: Full=U-myrmeciitoxin(01)-Mg5a; Short=MIITX(01)-Mg5a; Short=U-MIITX(01)-Mg5a; Flags: Precursor [Myrmecia gulosa]
MRLSYLSLALAIIFVLTIMHASNVEAKASADPEPDAVGSINVKNLMDMIREQITSRLKK